MSLRNYNVTKISFSKRHFLIPIIFIVFVLLFYLIYNDIKEKTINEFNHQQLILAQAASQGITSSFQNYQYELNFLSQHKCIIDFNDDTKVLMTNFYNNHKNLIEAVTRVDSRGKILFTYPYNQSAIGQDISYQKHIRQVLATHQTVISDVFMSVQGYFAVALHVPVFKGKEFKGSIAILIQLDKLGKQYFGKIKSRETNNAWLLSEDGIEIFCLIEGHTGKSFLDLAHKDSLAIKLMEKIKKENQGTAKSIHDENNDNQQDKFVEKYMVFYRVPLGNTYWTILISYNEEEIYASLNSFRNRLIIIFTVLFIVMVYYFYSLTKVRTILNEETQRKKAEKTLYDSEERFKKLFYDHSAVKLLIDSETGNITDANKAASKFYGWTIEELKRMKIFQINILPPDEIKKEMESARNKEKTYFEFKHRRADGSIRDVGIYSGLISLGEKKYLHSVIHDITSRKQAEEVMRKIEWEKETILDSLVEHVIHEDIDMKILWANKAASESAGLTREQLVGRYCYEIWLKRSEACPDCPVQKAMKTNQIQEVEKSTPDGKTWFIRGYPQQDEKGNIVGGIEVTMDITERKLSEETLKQSQLKYKQLFDDDLTGNFIISLDGTIELCNLVMAKIFGCDSVDELMKWNFTKFYRNTEDREKLLDLIREKKKVERYEQEHITRDGRVIILIKNVIGEFDENGELIRLKGYMFDDTERKVAEKALRQSETKLQVIIESTADGILAVDPNGKVIKTNNRFAELWKIPPSILHSGDDNELLNFVLDQLVDPKQFLNKVRLLYNSKDENFDTLFFKDGRIFERYSAPLLMEDEVLGRVWSFHDITNRRHAEEELREKENRMRMIVEGTPYLFFYTQDTKGMVLYVSPSVEKITGHSVDEWLNQSHWFITENKINEYAKEKTRAHLRGELTKGPILVEVQHADKHPILLEVYENPIIKDKKIIGLQGVAHDITESKRAEETLRESEEKFRNLVENINEVFYITNQEGKITYCSPNITNTVGFTSKEILNNSYLRFIAPIDYRIVIDHYLEQAAKGESDTSLEFRFRCKDGKIIWAEQITHIVRDTSGNVVEYRNVAREITERKQAEEELKKLSRAVEQSPVSVVITNAEGEIEYVNKKFCEVTGYYKEEVSGKNPRILKSDNHDKNFYTELWKHILSGKDWQGEMLNKKKNGELYWESSLISPLINTKGEITNYIAVKEDITEKKKMIDDLIRAKELADQSNKLKDAFIANMSHEIRTPLNGILGLSSLIKDTYTELINEEDKELFVGIDQSSERIIRTIDMILNYSRIQTGEFPISPDQIELSLICENLVKEFTTAAKSKWLELSFENRCGKTITIFSDEYSITNAISNLIDNAIKYTNEGAIEVILYTGKNDEVLLDIKDSGIGIGEEYLQYIFEPYRQEQIGYGRAYEGIGLGLSMVKNFLNLNNATISIDSEKGKGTTFTINFGKSLQPLAEKITEVIIDRTFAIQETQSKPLVLIVEDDAINQTTIKRFIKDGYNTISTDSSDEAIELLKNNKVDMILMDISIKGSKNGLELTKELKVSKEYLHIPIIGVTAHAFESDRNNALEAGCDDYISKPFSKNLLLDTIAKFV